jgi:hypothetical protein
MNKKVQQLLSVNGLIITTAGISWGIKKAAAYRLTVCNSRGNKFFWKFYGFFLRRA